MTANDRYESHLSTRYASRAMSELWSDMRRARTWRRIWTALAEAQKAAGLPIADAQIAGLKAHLDDVDLAKAAEWERRLRHDVMAHVHTLKDQCPEAGPIIHLGATSCDVTDNADLIVIREALRMIERKLLVAIARLRAFALAERGRPCVGFTHFQPAQITTVGKRATLWLQDFVLDLEELRFAVSTLRFRGLRGATGTQDSFLKLLGGDAARVRELERDFAARLGFTELIGVCGQTYTRKQDARVLNALSAIGQSASKMAGDLRLLCHENELEEPFGKEQIGSSAMAYKRNPMRSERIGALSRFLIILAQNPAHTAATQWLERTLDDSANRRLALTEGFLAADAVLELVLNVTSGLVVRGNVIARHVREQLPFIASEEILMHAVKAGGDRQELHEVIRTLSIEAHERVKEEGLPNDFLARAEAHPVLGPVVRAMGDALAPERFTGLAAEQVEAFIADRVDPLLLGVDVGGVGDEVRV